MSENILVYIDQYKGKALPASWEALGAAAQLASQTGGAVQTLVIGENAQEVAVQAFQYGAEEVFYADDPSLNDYRPDPYTAVVAQVGREHEPAIVLFPTSARGREQAAMAAIDLDTGVMSDVTEMEVRDGKVVATRPVYAGKLLSKAVCEKRPQIITLRSRAFDKPEPDGSRSGAPTQVSAPMPAGEIKTEVVEYAAAEGGVSLADASVIVSGGRGLANNPALEPPDGMSDNEAEIWRAQQGFKMIGELASVLDGAVGASRAAVDAGYIPYEHQVGQTGKVVAPDLYIAAGISGAIQHLAGMRTSKVIVAINKDPEAPIFKLARFGVVGDLFKIVPALTEALRERLGK